MSLPRNQDETDILDLSLKHILRNWVGRSKSPADCKTYLLNAASGMSRKPSTPKKSKIAILISMTLNDDFLELYLESSRKTPYYSLLPGAMSMNYPNGMFAK